MDYPFSHDDIAAFHAITYSDATAIVDQQTASDMLLNQYADRLSAESSILGRQVLHQRLRQNADTQASITRVRSLLKDTDQLRALQDACRPLREVDTEISAALFADKLPPISLWHRWLWLLPASLALSLLLAFAVNGLAWIAVLLLWGILLLTQLGFQQAVGEWERKICALQQLLRGYSLLGNLELPLAREFEPCAVLAGKLNRGIGRSIFVLLPGAREYADWILLNNIQNYFRSSILVRRHLDFLRQAYLLLANLDADLALARHLQSTGQYCWVEQSQDKHVNLEGMVHPLLDQAHPLSMHLAGKGAFISGQNGIGKSTLLRAVGLNLIVARAFGFCYARVANLPSLEIYSGMHNEDSLTDGESLYQAELRRAKELIALAERRPASLFIIDEIFRGTNHIESISAAAAVLHALAKSGLIIVSSHNLVLATLLEDHLTPFCVGRSNGEGKSDGNAGNLQLMPGVLNETNGIALLSESGFGSEIESKAQRVFDWLSRYMTKPEVAAGVLE